MSCDTQRLLKNTEHFKLLCSLKYEDIIPVSIYRSEITGITVCIAEVDGPFIDGDFNIVTETFDNDGLPYAVKRLICTGSKDYPYNKILSVWAVRSLASNIIADSFQQSTCFSIRAAGSEGFLTLMPKYLDHILFPSLKDSAYLIEVHHITGRGIHSGKIYCKTQIKECTSDYIIRNIMLRELYPGKCGYNSIIKGTTKNFRESTSNEKVKQFHEKFYRPENLTVVITGKIQPCAIFQALQPLEEKIMLKERKDVFEKPWQTPINPLKESVDVEVLFPSKKEEYGEIHVAWRGPSKITHLCDYRGCFLLLCYLITRDSPLTKKFGEIGDHSFITWNMNYWSDPYFEIIVKNVPVEQIDLITSTSIHKILRNVCTDGINMETMKIAIHKIIFEYQNILDNNPHEIIAPLLYNHLIYENTNTLEKQFNVLREWEYLKNESETYFLTLLKTYFVDAPMVFIKGKPSLDMYYTLQDEEINVTEQTEKLLGQHYLQLKEKVLHEAFKEQYKTIPDEDLCKVPMSGIDSITYHHIERYNTETDKQHPKLDVKKLPLFTYLDDVNINFFYLQIVMDTSSITPEFKLFIPLLVKVITESPVKRGDQLISFEKIDDFLFADNIKVQSHKGIDTSGRIPDSMSLMLQTQLHNYEKCVQRCKEFLYDTVLTVDNVKVAITQLLNNNKLQEKTIPTILMTTLLYNNDTHWFTDNILQQHKFLTDIQERLNTDEGQKEVIAKIEFVRQILTSPENMIVYMAVNVNKLTKQFPDVFAPWNEGIFSNFMNLEKKKPNITPSLNLLTRSNSIYNGCIMGLVWIKSSYFIQTCPCISDAQHPDLPALKVCLAYFRDERGPIWIEIGEEQALSNEFDLDTTEDGYLHLTFGPITNLVTIYITTRLIVMEHLAETKWKQLLFEKAKASVILNYINNVQTIKHVMSASLTSYCKNLPPDYDYEMIRRVSAVTIDDLSRVTNQYIKPLFDPKQCKIAIVSNIDTCVEIKEAFQKLEFNFNVFKSLDELKDYIENKDY